MAGHNVLIYLSFSILFRSCLFFNIKNFGKIYIVEAVFSNFDQYVWKNIRKNGGKILVKNEKHLINETR